MSDLFSVPSITINTDSFPVPSSTSRSDSSSEPASSSGTPSSSSTPDDTSGPTPASSSVESPGDGPTAGEDPSPSAFSESASAPITASSLEPNTSPSVDVSGIANSTIPSGLTPSSFSPIQITSFPTISSFRPQGSLSASGSTTIPTSGSTEPASESDAATGAAAFFGNKTTMSVFVSLTTTLIGAVVLFSVFRHRRTRRRYRSKSRSSPSHWRKSFRRSGVQPIQDLESNHTSLALTTPIMTEHSIYSVSPVEDATHTTESSRNSVFLFTPTFLYAMSSSSHGDRASTLASSSVLPPTSLSRSGSTASREELEAANRSLSLLRRELSSPRPRTSVNVLEAYVAQLEERISWLTNELQRANESLHTASPSMTINDIIFDSAGSNAEPPPAYRSPSPSERSALSNSGESSDRSEPR